MANYGKHLKILIHLLTVLALLFSSAFILTGCTEQDSHEELPPPQSPPPVDRVDPEPEDHENGTSEEIITGTPFERYGELQVLNGQLSDSRGNPVQLKGMSTFGIQWSDGYWVLTDEAFGVLADDWQCDIIRIAMYITEGGYRDNPALILERVERGIELATKHGMYVMVDWHILTPGDPTDLVYLEAGLNASDMPRDFLALRDANPDWTGPQVFFGYIAQKYGSQGNVLYEPANEPNRLGSHGERFDVWSRVLKPYFESIIKVIREFDSNGIIICGTDNWSQYVDAPIHDRIEDPNVMYAMHFYAGTHDAGYDADRDRPQFSGEYWLRKMVDEALIYGLAVFCTEWGTSTATGDGGPYIDFSLRWIEFMEDRGISWTAWSMAQKREVSAAFNYRTSPHPAGEWPEEEVSVSGRFYRAMIRGERAPIYIDESGTHNGDVRFIPADDKGVFISLPFLFETGKREGWEIHGDTLLENSHLSVGIAETQALMFPFTFVPEYVDWEFGARLSSPNLPWNVERCRDIRAFTMELFLEDGKATAGEMRLTIIPEPDGASYWHEAGYIAIDPVNGGEVFVNSEGVTLRRYTIKVPFSIADYSEEVRVRRIILVLCNYGESDYSGNVFYDNIGFEMQ
jgi:endoglucanase